MYYIYRITNLINNKTYIGQHKYKKINDYYMGGGKNIKRAIKKYGRENFKKEIIEYNIQSREEANKKEMYYISLERNNGKSQYNITAGGDGFRGNHTEETKKKISKASKGNTYGFKKGQASWNKGIHYKINDTSNMHHQSWNKGLKGYRAGIPKSEEQKTKMKETALKYALQYKEYKKSGGILMWNDWKKEFSHK